MADPAVAAVAAAEDAAEDAAAAVEEEAAAAEVDEAAVVAAADGAAVAVSAVEVLEEDPRPRRRLARVPPPLPLSEAAPAARLDLMMVHAASAPRSAAQHATASVNVTDGSVAVAAVTA